MKSVIVTAAERGYFGLAMGLVRSIRDAERATGAAQPLTIKLLDIGLEPQQRAQFDGLCDVFTPPQYHMPLDRVDHEASRLRSRAVKPFLREYFPGYELYLYLDADCWVQNLNDLRMLMQAGAYRGLALTPMIDRTYPELYRKDSEMLRWMNKVHREVIGPDRAEKLLYLPGLNAGAYSARHDSPLWEHYGNCLREVFEKAKRILDQPAFNVAIYENRIPYYPLPSRFNWLCIRSLPQVDLRRRALTEPGIPFEPLGIVHLTHRLIGKEFALTCNDGKKRPFQLDYFGFHRSLSKHAAVPDPQAQPATLTPDL